MLFEKKSFKEIDWTSVKASTLEGTISGALGAATGGGLLFTKKTVKLTGKQIIKKATRVITVSATFDGGINAFSQAVVKGEVDWDEVKTSAAIGVFSGLAGDAFSKIKFINTVT
ncbi:MAG TPA: hypothetical protein DC000_01325 [Clostridiales bacterium]|nr:hypothetical protein [Clostridiales bacterium]